MGLKHRNMSDPKLPSTPNKLVDIQAFENIGDLQLINGYCKNGFRISGARYNSPVLLCPRHALCWQPPDHLDALSLDYIVPHLGNIPPPLFILGVGGAPKAPLIELAESLKGVGIMLEIMSTAAACRTWNVLMSEGRDAATGLYVAN